MIVGQYRLLEHIGSGGFGEVFRAKHEVLGREVAIKFLHARYSSSSDIVARFVAEAKAVAKLSHPNIVSVIDFGRHGDRYYHVMELLRGASLRALLQERERLTLDESIPILRSIAEALDTAHGHGIAHRDLKPDNVFIGQDGTVTLIDFGLAKLVSETNLTESGAQFGTPAYMSPEQCRGKTTSVATDAYSFGALLFHMLSGRPPFEGDALEVALHHLNDPPPRLSAVTPLATPAVDDVCRRLLAKDPAARPTSLVAAVELLRSPKRRRAKAIMAVILCGVVGVAGLAAMRDTHRSETRYRLETALVKIEEPTTLIGINEARQLVYETTTSFHSLDLATSEVAAKTDSRIERAGRHIEHTDDGVAVVGRDGTRIPIPVKPYGLSNQPALSHAGDKVLVADLDGIYLFDIRTKRMRKIVEAERSGRALWFEWSPDDRKVILGDPSGRVELRSIDTDLSVRLAISVLKQSTVANGVAFLDGTHVVYCAEDSAGSIDVRSREATDVFGYTERVLASISDEYAMCSLAVSDGIVGIVANRGRPRAATATFFRSGSAPVPIEGVGDSNGIALTTNGAVVLSKRATKSLYVRNHDGGVLAPLRTCGDGDTAVSDGPSLVRFKIEADKIIKLDNECVPLQGWDIPKTEETSVRCANSRCFAARFARDVVSLWELVPGELKPIATIKREIGESAFAVSHDASKLALLTNHRGPTIVVVDTGQVTNVTMRTSDVEILQGLAWSERSDRLIVSAMNVDDTNYAALSVAFDGSYELLWGSNANWFRVSDANAGTAVGTVRQYNADILLLRPEH